MSNAPCTLYGTGAGGQGSIRHPGCRQTVEFDCRHAARSSGRIKSWRKSLQGTGPVDSGWNKGGVRLSSNRRFSIHIDKARRVVEVRYSGTISLADRAQAVETGSRVLEENGYRKVLVDLSNAEMAMEPPEEESRFADLLSSNPQLARCRTAFLANPDHSINWFIEVLAKARHYECEHFTDREAAHAWLAEGSED